MDVDYTGTIDKISYKFWLGVNESGGGTWVAYNTYTEAYLDAWVLSTYGNPDYEADYTSITSGEAGTTYDNLIAKWTCLFMPLISGTWEFYNAERDDLGFIEIRSGDSPISPRYMLLDGTGSKTTCYLTAGRYYYLYAKWYELYGPGKLTVQFKEPGASGYTTVSSKTNVSIVRKYNGFIDNALWLGTTI